jgi:hypothetical protein
MMIKQIKKVKAQLRENNFSRGFGIAEAIIK